MTSPCAPLSQHHHVFTNKDLQNPSSEGFMEALLHSHDCLNHWQLAIDSTSKFSPLPGGKGVRLKVQPSNHMIGYPWKCIPIVRCGPNFTSLTYQKTPLLLSSLRKLQGFGEL